VGRYFRNAKTTVDPFARNNTWAAFTNDINPNTTADYHKDARDFLRMIRDMKIVADVVVFDPPYSPRQITEHYAACGKKATMLDTQTACLYAECRKLIWEITEPGSVVLSFGWNSCGMGKIGWDILEIMLVAHGGAHNDTICMAEKRISVMGL
jgi:hypothetical protein